MFLNGIVDVVASGKSDDLTAELVGLLEPLRNESGTVIFGDRLEAVGVLGTVRNSDDVAFFYDVRGNVALLAVNGDLLFNMKYMRETGIFAKAREELRRKKLTFADQSALIRATTKKKMLAQKFNDQKFLHSHTVVRHFSKRLFWLPYPHTENIKQWQVEKVRRVFGYRQFDDVLDEYLMLVQNFGEKKHDA